MSGPGWLHQNNKHIQIAFKKQGMGFVDALGTGMWAYDSGSLRVSSFVTRSWDDGGSSCIPSGANAIRPWNVR